MKRITFIAIIFVSIAALVLPGGCKGKSMKKVNISTVKEMDINRYLGKWYEIARFDHSFERGLVGVTATYSFRPDGKIKVVNEGYQNTLDGKHSIAVGKAKTTSEPGKLKVSFFWIFYGAYNVLELDADYQWVLVGSSSDKYLWILSRTPALAPEVLSEIVEKARLRGYDTSKLIWVEQQPG